MPMSVLVLRVAFWCFVLVLVFASCCMVVEGRPAAALLTGCRGGHGSCLDSIHASPSDINDNVKISAHGAADHETNGRLRPWEPEIAGGVDGSVVVRSELRWVPSGPDPLHHNGGSPRRPQTP